MKIKKIFGYEILDSRGNPTTACKISLVGGLEASAYVPSGASTGKYEAVELRDGDSSRYNGLGVEQAVYNINHQLADALVGQDSRDQFGLDKLMCELDGTNNKSNLGANAILAVSLALAKVTALAYKQDLYQYLGQLFSPSLSSNRFPKIGFNVLNGGKHADSGLDIQEYMILPIREDIRENIRMGAEIYHTLKNLLKSSKQVVAVGDEGGFAPHLDNNEQGLKLLVEAISQAGYIPGQDCLIALDAAASEFFDSSRKIYTLNQVEYTGAELAVLYQQWLKAYPIRLLEDPFAEDDYDSWQAFMPQIPEDLIVVGDDLLVTNPERIQQAVDSQLCNAALIKPNQIGTLSQTIQAISLAHSNAFRTMISHRSADTIDTFIADLAMAGQSEYLKSGAPARAERVAKYNRLLEIYYSIK